MSGPDARIPVPSIELDTQEQNEKIFRIYHIYRFTLSVILLISFFYRAPNSPLGSIDPGLFLQLVYFYLGVNLMVLVMSYSGLTENVRLKWIMSFSVVIFDILLLVMLSYTCGGVSSGMAHLMLMPVAAGSILFGTRLGIFFASIGSIAAIYSEAFLSFSLPGHENFYVQAGLLGLILFVTSLGLQYLSHRIRQKELINRQQAASIQSLQQINQQVIQRIQAGIVVVDKEGGILISNTSARRLLLDDSDDITTPKTLPEPLLLQMRQWQEQPEQNYPPVQLAPNAPEVLASYSFLQTETGANIMVFLEDYSQLSSRAQHLKLMSLGRLSASIAHEIRNPLGAISHACQLLGESDKVDAEDKRLLSIINHHTQRVNTIIESILEHSRVRQHLPELFPLKSWLEQFVSRFRNSYSYRLDCHLDIEGDPLIRFNQSQLERLLTNLSDNALRYSQKLTGKAGVAIRAYVNPANQCPVIDVVDFGPGVPDSATEHIFEPFFTTEINGTGLGLFICKEICEANQALIFHTRSDDGLSCFRIQFAHPERSISLQIPLAQTS